MTSGLREFMRLAGTRKKAQKGVYTKRNVWDDAGDLEVFRGGEKLDPGVNYFVLMLDQLGLPTAYSCEGHPGGFYITFAAPYELALRLKSAGHFSFEIEGEEYWSMRKNYLGEGDPEKTRIDGLRWAAGAWEKQFGPLDFENVRLSK